jgi:hypothetical protein
MDNCTHHWIIDKANGPTSNGLCSLCGEKRPFLNSWDSAVENKFLKTPNRSWTSKAARRRRRKEAL